VLELVYESVPFIVPAICLSLVIASSYFSPFPLMSFLNLGLMLIEYVSVKTLKCRIVPILSLMPSQSPALPPKLVLCLGGH